MKSILEELFSEGFSASSAINSKRPVDIIEFPCVHKDDSEPVSIIWPDIQQGPWIAGGACLRWFQGQPVGESDIDIFCSSREQAESIVERIKSYGRYSTKYESDNAITLSYHNKDSR